MKLQGPKLSFRMQGDDVALLHRELQYLGFTVGPTELERQFFGETTLEVVKQFQSQHRLPATGEVDERTAELINAEVERLRPKPFVVKGGIDFWPPPAVRLNMSGNIVRAYDRDIRSEQVLGEAVTDFAGHYEISYSATQFRRGDKGTADLMLRLYDREDTQLAVSGFIMNEQKFVPSHIFFNAPPELTVSILIAEQPTLSEYEQLLARLTPVLEGVQPADLTDQDITFLLGELSGDTEDRELLRKRIELLRQAAKLGREAELPTEAGYGWGHQHIPLVLDQLLARPNEKLVRALRIAFENNIIPTTLGAFIDQILRRLDQLRSERAFRKEQSRIPHEVVGQLLNHETGEPIVGYRVHAFDLDRNERDLGVDGTDGQGFFTVVYTTAKDESIEEGRRLRFVILDPQDKEIHRVDERVKADPQQVLTLRIPVPATPAPQSPKIEELPVAVPPALRSVLTQGNIQTLADIRGAGGIGHLVGVEFAGSQAVRDLEAHADLNRISPNIVANQALIGQGYTRTLDVAKIARSTFVTDAQPQRGDYKAAEMQVVARAQAHFLNNVLMRAQADLANGNFPNLGIRERAAVQLPMPIRCQCRDCEAVVSPIAYLADLLDYAVDHVQNGGAAISLPFLNEQFHQRFGELLASCTEANEQVRQVRLCIEVLRRYLGNRPLADATKEQKLSAAEKAYRLEAYTTLLNRLGTSYEEVRLAKNAGQAERDALAERLGFELDPSHAGSPRNDQLDQLLLDPEAQDPQVSGLTEEALEGLFGLVDTTRYPLSDGITEGDTDQQIHRWNLDNVEWGLHTDEDGRIYLSLKETTPGEYHIELYRDKARADLVAKGRGTSPTGPVSISAKDFPDFTGRIEIDFKADSPPAPNDPGITLLVVPEALTWRLRQLRAVWKEQDRPTNAFADPRVIPDPDNPRLPLIDPDVIGPDDFRYPYARMNTGDPKTPFDLWLERRRWVDDQLRDLKTKREQEGHNGLDIILTLVLGDPLPELNGLLNQLSQSDEPETIKLAKNEITNTLHLTVESFTRLMAIIAKDELHKDITEADWQEVYSILVQVKKVRDQYSQWMQEERKEWFGPNQFWISLRQPKTGTWPPAYLAQSPLIVDPEIVKKDQLQDLLPGKPAALLWEIRSLELEQLNLQLVETHKTPALGLEDMLVQALGSQPQPDATWVEKIARLNNELQSANLAIVEHTRKEISATLRMGLEQFVHLADIVGRSNETDPAKQPTDKEWRDVYALLTSAWRLRDKYATWITEERSIPLIDPDRVKLNELPEPTAGRRAITLWHNRFEALEEFQKDLKDLHRKSGLIEVKGFKAILNEALGHPNRGGNPQHDLDTLREQLNISDPAKQNEVIEAKKSIMRDLFMTVDEFNRFLETRDKIKETDPAKKPSADELAELYPLLVSAHKQKHLYPTWVNQEKTELEESSVAPGIPAYWLARKAALPAWLASAETRQAWLQALRVRSCPSIIDPDLIEPQADLIYQSSGVAYDIHTQRFKEVQDSLNALKSKRTSAPTSLSGFNAMLVESLFGAAATEPQDVLVKSVIGLEEENQKGNDITRRLEQFNLTMEAFSFLLRIHKLAENNAPITDAEWTTVENILVQVEKQRKSAEWRDIEKEKAITLSPDYFKIPEIDPGVFPPTSPVTLARVPWRATVEARQDWQDTLLTRIDQQQAMIDAWQSAVTATEEETLPALRDALVMASDAVGVSLDDKAKWIAEFLLIDAKNDGCAMTTRIAQAIETIQSLVFGVRTGLFPKAQPGGLTLDADDFEEEWRWVGSYATWRAAMFVFAYPENILLPSFRKYKTTAFAKLIRDLRSNRNLTPGQACVVAKEYSDYFRDVCNLDLKATCQARTRIYKGEGCGKTEKTEADLFYMFALGESKRVYWTIFNPDIVPDDFAQTFWTEIPGLQGVPVTDILGAVPYSPPGNRYIYLFALALDKEKQKLVFVKYDLEKGRWDQESNDLDSPVKEGSWTVVVKQTASDSQPPHLAFRLDTGAILDRRLNREGRDWEEQPFRTMVDAETGKLYTTLHAMVEYEDTSFYLFVKGGDEAIWYKLFRLFDVPLYRLYSEKIIDHFYTTNIEERNTAREGYYEFEWIEGYIGAAQTQGTEPLFRFYYEPGTDHVYTRSGEERSRWIEEKLKNEGIAGHLNPTKVAGTWELYRLFKVEHGDVDHFYTTSDIELATCQQPSDPRDPHPRFGYTYESVVGYITDRTWLSMEGQWEWIGALCWATDQGVYVFLKPKGKRLTRYFWLKAMETPKGFPNAILLGLMTLANHSGTGPQSDKQLVAYKGNPTLFTSNRYRCLLSQDSGLNLRSQKPVAVTPTGPFEITNRLTQTELQLRRSHIELLFKSNHEGPQSNLTYLEEAYYFIPVHLGLQLQTRGHYTEALDWFRNVLDYSMPVDQRKIYYGLKREESLPPVFQRADNWLLDPLDPHSIAETRENTYTRFTLLSIIRCLLAFADDEFTLDTSESVPQARALYMQALELLDTSDLIQKLGECDNLIGHLNIEVIPDAGPVLPWIKQALTYIPNTSKTAALINEVTQALIAAQPWEIRLERAKVLIHQARLELPATPSLATAAAEKPKLLAQVHTALLRSPVVAQAMERVGVVAGRDFVHAVSVVSKIPVTTLVDEQTRAELPWLREPMTSVIKDQAIAPFAAVELTRNIHTYVPTPVFHFCVPPNPVLKALRFHAEVNLYKIRTCRNIAGMERQLEPYSAATDTVTGLPIIGAGGNLVLPGTTVFRPTPYRYAVLIERAKQLVQLATQIEAAMLSTLEKRDVEAYSVLKVRQEVRLARAGVRLQDLRVKEAQDGVTLAELQQERAQIQITHYEDWINGGLNIYEQAAIAFMVIAVTHQVAAGIVSFVKGDYPAGFSSGGQAFSTMGSIASMWASFERRSQEWELNRDVAQQDVRIGAQQVRIANDHFRVTEQERVIAGLQSDHAEATVDFLSNKFTNVELYDWMSGVLEGVYSFFLQQATAMAKLAENQLAFERQEVPPAFIQADYWEAPSDEMGGNTDGQAPNRRGLTGSARLLQDIYQLDQHAFETNKRKLQLTKTISLAQMAPAEFQRFRETGVMPFETSMAMFDRDFPGHYLRLVKRVRTSVVALIPPSQGIRATLSALGVSRVVIGPEVFQTTVIRRPPESIALSSPRDATGLFELTPQTEAEMLLAFEALGVDTRWEFRLPKPANLFDYSTIADVLVTIDYTALNSFDYYQQVIQSPALTRPLSLERPFSFRQQLADQWFDLNNPDQTKTPMTVRFTTRRKDFASNLDKLKIQHVVLYFARANGKTFEVPVTHLKFIEPDGTETPPAGATSKDGVISTRRGNAGSWAAMQGKAPFGEWELALPATGEMINRFKNEEIEDILFVVTYEGRTPAWPT